jgi:HAD superfamily phosphoserine phosphatase-like hydrolase
MKHRMSTTPLPRLVAFDVDGTLLRGETVCECIARHIGRTEDMKSFELLRSQAEIAAARRVMLDWYAPFGRASLLGFLRDIRLAPGARTGVACLRERGIKTALVSITWHFAVEWLAGELGADYAVGTGWADPGEVADFWPDDKATWLAALLTESRIAADALIAVGDSAGDVPMLRLAGRGYFVGAIMPEAMAHVVHLPGGDIQSIVEDMLATRY